MVVPSSAMASLRAEAVGDWEACGDYFYTKELLYEMSWHDMELEHKRVACAAFGGPIATVRDDSQTLVLQSSATRPVFRIFDTAGRELGNMVWEGSRIAAIGWTADEALMVVDESGKVSFWSMHGERLPCEFSLGQEVEAEGVALAATYEDGIVVLTRSNKLWAVAGLEDPKPRRLAAPPLLQPPACLTLLQPQYTLSSQIEVLVASSQCIWLVDELSAQDHVVCSGTSVTMVAVSPDGRFVAAFTQDGHLIVMSSDFSQRVSELDTASPDPPLSMAWCGVDAVVLRWPEMLLVAGPKDCARYPLEDGGVVLVPERDGLRVLSNTRHELLRRVPESVEGVFQPGATGPGAQLWEAREQYEQRIPKTDRTLRALKGQLTEAVMACVAAAGWDLSVPRQKALLRSAIFGRAFCPSLPPLMLHEAAVKLRILNAVRDPSIARPLTLSQLEVLTVSTLVERLVNSRHHLLAFRMAEALGEGQEGVLVDWAKAKISSAGSTPDLELKDAITARLKGCVGIRFAAIAEHAEALGRRQLALKLLEEESSSAAQVPLLLRLHRPQPTSTVPGEEADTTEDALSRALKKAIDSGDPDLVHLVLFHLHRTLPQAQFWALVNSRGLARNLFFKYCRAQDPELLEQLYASMSLVPEAADLALRGSVNTLLEAAAAPTGRAPQPAQDKFLAGLADSAHRYSGSREHQYQSKALAEWAMLRREQMKLEKETGQQLYLGLGVLDTIRQAVRLGNHRAAMHIKKVFSVSDKRYAWLKIRVLAEGRDWEGLEAFAGEKKNHPLGWDLFLEIAQANGAPKEYQARLIARMPDSKAKAEEWASLGYQQEAAEVAAKLRDQDLFAKIQSAVSATSPAGLAIAQIKDRFASTFRQ